MIYIHERTDDIIIGFLTYYFKTFNINDYKIFHKIKDKAMYTNTDIIKAIFKK